MPKDSPPNSSNKPRIDWSDAEVHDTVESYFAMLREELRGEDYNKTAYRRDLLLKLSNRTEGAIERKHQNISWVLSQLGLPWINGYKPLSNAQALLRDVVTEFMGATGNELIDAAANVPPVAREVQWAGALVDPPVITEHVPAVDTLTPPQRRIIKNFDFAKRDQANRKLGRAGEQFVLDYERWWLTELGLADLAEKVRWVSEEFGDGAGYDILSFDESGCALHIEVKTTNLGSEAPFFVSYNEVSFSEENSDSFKLYRVFNFSSSAKLYILSGSLHRSVRLEPKQYQASPL